MAAAFRRVRYPFENMTAPCAIEKVRRRRRCFSLFSIQLEMPRTTACRHSSSFVRNTHATQSAETLTQRTRDQPKCHDTPQPTDDECINPHFAADRSRKTLESRIDDTQHPIQAQPDSLREPL